MIVLPKHKMTADEFLAWAEALPKEAGKFELWDGDVIVKHGPAGQMNAERSQHWDVKGAAYRALHDAIRRAGLEHRALIRNQGFPKSANCDSPCLEVDHGAMLFGGSAQAGRWSGRRRSIAARGGG
jgi:hypothetical protein